MSSIFITNMNGVVSQDVSDKVEDKPQIPADKIISYEEKSLGSTSFFKCEACPYMALAEDDIKFHLFTVHPELAKTNGLAENIQIPCPGCASIFDAEETLRNHLRNHHKMGIKDVKKMVKSLVQIALKNAKLKKENVPPDTPTPISLNEHISDIKIPQLIEIRPDAIKANDEKLLQGVSFISVNELQNMSTPNFEKINPKDIIQEANINIVYSNEVPTQYKNMPDTATTNALNLHQISNVTPDLISSIQPHPAVMENTDGNIAISPERCDKIPLPPIAKRSPPFILQAKPKQTKKEVTKKIGEMCSVSGCHVRFKSEEKLVYHRKCHQNGGLQCPECNTKFPSMEQLNTHLWKGHSVDMELHTCSICSYKSVRLKRLTMHMTSHGDIRAYPCRECTKSFKNSHSLAKHNLIHKKECLVKCEACQRQFLTERRLRNHIAAVHEKLRPFQCSHCEFTSARKDELKLHVRAHTGDKPYACDSCEYKCSDHNSMRRHKKRHSKESLYKCQLCTYTCIQSTQLTSHILHKHPTMPTNKLFICPYCIFKSVSKDKYIAHLNNHADKDGIQLLIDVTKNPVQAKPRWTIPSHVNQVANNTKETNQLIADQQQTSIENTCMTTVNNIPIELDDCDSQQGGIPRNYPQNYCTDSKTDNSLSSIDIKSVQDMVVTDLSKDDNNSDCVISESSNDTLIERHYTPQLSLQNINYVSVEQNLLQHSNVIDSLAPNNSYNQLPSLPQISVRNNINLKPVDRIHIPVSVTGSIIKPTQILPVPSSRNSPVNLVIEYDGIPRKKAKISVKSNLILKGPDQVNMFHSQQKMAFKRLEDSERFGLNSPVTFNDLITTQLMQLPDASLTESSDNIIYPQETIMSSSTTNLENRINANSELYTFNPPMNVNAMSMLPPQQKLPADDPSYIKIESTIKQNTQSPGLERMCNANSMINNVPITREYKASPPLEDINKNMNEIKNEVKSDTYYNLTLNNRGVSSMMDPYLMANVNDVPYSNHLELSTLQLQDQQSDIIEIDDNSDDNKLVHRYDMNFPLESLYLMNNDFHFLDNDIPGQCLNNISSEVNDISRIEVPIINQTIPNINRAADVNSIDCLDFICTKKDPNMNTHAKKSTNKINVKNIELMKN